MLFNLGFSVSQVVDLLVTMARAAANSSRKKLIFEPYPSVVDPDDRSRLAFSPEVCRAAGSAFTKWSIFGRLFVKRFALWYRNIVCSVCL